MSISSNRTTTTTLAPTRSPNPFAPPRDDRGLMAPEVSIVIPCLNEADTIGLCISKAQRALDDHGINGEIVVADNGSSDGSPQIAFSLGARVVGVGDKGYGNALMGGIEASAGKYVIMGDADDSYDFGEIPKFVAKLREGHEIVQGCRLPSGGGRVMPGAMPLLHRWWGNPMFSVIARCWFAAPIHDVYCGMRGFTRELYKRLDLRSPGMEFATEMIIKASRHNARFAEVPITLHPDGRRSHPPHLKTFRDGWRTLRFLLVHSPRWLFLEPGKLLMALGLIAYLLVLANVKIGGVALGPGCLMIASLAILCGQQAVLFAVGTKTVAIAYGLLPPDERIKRFFKRATLERGLLIGATALVIGTGMLLAVANVWRRARFGALDLELSMRWVIPAATLTALGVQTILLSFFISIIGTFGHERTRK